MTGIGGMLKDIIAANSTLKMKEFYPAIPSFGKIPLTEIDHKFPDMGIARTGLTMDGVREIIKVSQITNPCAEVVLTPEHWWENFDDEGTAPVDTSHTGDFKPPTISKL